MIYLSGVVRPEIDGSRKDLGLMLQPGMGNVVDLTRIQWAGDNGCYAAGAAFNLTAFLAWLERRYQYRSSCLFAVAPDVLSDAQATWERSKPILPVLRRMGFKAALVAQNGLETLPLEWDAFDVLFIGGCTRFKLSHHARELVAEAKARGKWVHMGRVNSERRLRTATMWGCDSADGTYLRPAPDINFPKMIGWLDAIKRAPNFIFADAP